MPRIVASILVLIIPYGSNHTLLRPLLEDNQAFHFGTDNKWQTGGITIGMFRKANFRRMQRFALHTVA